MIVPPRVFSGGPESFYVSPHAFSGEQLVIKFYKLKFLLKADREIKELIYSLKLLPHPEGGYYREVHRSSEKIKKAHLPERFSGDRNFATSIYYLLPGDTFSSFHRIRSDETWHFYKGSTLSIYIIDFNGFHLVEKLGLDIKAGEKPQITVNAGCWFAAKTDDEDSYTLTGCTVSPGFDFEDMEFGVREKMINEFPEQSELIKMLTR